MGSEYTPAFSLADDPDPDPTRKDYTARTGEFLESRRSLKHQVLAYVSPTRVTALVGGMGGGKTTGIMKRHNRVCAANGKARRRKDCLRVPKCAIVSPTFKTLMQSTLSAWYEVTDPRWIRRVRQLPNPHIELMNGVIIELHSSASTLEGQTYFQVTSDELSHPNYTDRFVANVFARCRDNDSPLEAINFASLAEAGLAQRLLDHPPHPAGSDGKYGAAGGLYTVMCATSDNTALRPETLAGVLASVPHEDLAKLVSGEWHQPVRALYPEFRQSDHLTGPEGDPMVPTHIAIDHGYMGAVLFGQLGRRLMALPDWVGGLGTPFEDQELRIVYQLLPENKDITGICQEIRATPFGSSIARGSQIWLDPTTDLQAVKEVRRFFPDAKVRTTPVAERKKERTRRIRTALRDGLGNIRLRIAPWLQGRDRGIVEALVGMIRNKEGQVDDDWLAHASDALGYLIQVMPKPYKLADLPKRKPRAKGRR